MDSGAADEAWEVDQVAGSWGRGSESHRDRPALRRMPASSEGPATLGRRRCRGWFPFASGAGFPMKRSVRFPFCWISPLRGFPDSGAGDRFRRGGAARRLCRKTLRRCSASSWSSTIPGLVQCALYDLGGEGVAYHDTDALNNGVETEPGSGHQRAHAGPHLAVPGTRVWIFRFVKDWADLNHTNLVSPAPEPVLHRLDREWGVCNYTVNVREPGRYRIRCLYAFQTNTVSRLTSAANRRRPVAFRWRLPGIIIGTWPTSVRLSFPGRTAVADLPLRKATTSRTSSLSR